MDKAEILNKEAQTKFPIHDLLKRRWSPVAFSDKIVEKEKLDSLLEAARWAPSSYNEQPWAFIVATKDHPAEFQRLLGCLVPANQEWAKNAPVLIISVAKLNFDRNGKENRHSFHDVGLAAANLVVQATSLGLHVHQMAGIEVEKIQSVYNIPNTHTAVAGIAVGYLGDLESLPENLRQRDLGTRSRKEQKDFVFTGSWGHTRK